MSGEDTAVVEHETRVVPQRQRRAAVIVLLATSLGSWSEVAFAIAMPAASLAMGIVVTLAFVGRLDTMPFSDDSEAEESEFEFGGLTFLAILLSLIGGGFALLARGWIGPLVAVPLLLLAVKHLQSNGRTAASRGG